MNLRPLHWPGARSSAGDAGGAWIAGLPVYRLAQSFEHETRPRELGLVLILASDREVRRARRLRSLRFGASAAAAAISATLMAAWMRPATTAPTRPAATIAQALSEHLERHPAMAAAARSGPASLRLDEALLTSGDRGY